MWSQWRQQQIEKAQNEEKSGQLAEALLVSETDSLVCDAGTLLVLTVTLHKL